MREEECPYVRREMSLCEMNISEADCKLSSFGVLRVLGVL